MKSVLKFLVLLISVAILDGVRFRCDYKNIEHGWFKFHKIPATWRDARSMCHLEGSILASPITSEIKAEMMRSVGKVDIFTGIHSIFSKGHYYSVDGIPLADIPHEWANDEPDNENNEEDCLTLNCEGKLSDVRCDKPRPYICYRENSNVDVNFCGTTDPEYRFESRTNKCYKFHTNPRTFDRAHFACSAEGGHLVIINSEEEANVVRELYAQYPDARILGTFRKDLIFVGFHNWGEDHDWRTIHGQKIQEAGFGKFANGEPNNGTGGESCGSMYRNALLNDLLCNLHFAFICEKKPDYPPVCDEFNERNNVKLVGISLK